VRKVDEETAVRVEHLCPDRNAKLDVLSFGAMLVRALAVNTTSAREPLPPTKSCKITEVGVRNEGHVAALASVSTVRPALRDELLAPKAERAVASASSPDLDPGAVTKHG